MFIIGIAGGTGCGKTTIVNQIMNGLPKSAVEVISQDSYYKDSSHLTTEERVKINFDHPEAIDFDLLKKHLVSLKEGKAIQQPVYSFTTHNRTKDTVNIIAEKIIIIEGILILSNQSIRNMCDLKIFIHADADERLMRRIKRDIQERGRDLQEVLNRYKTTLKPMHEKFIEPMKKYADIIIPNNSYNTEAVHVIRSVINERIS